MGKCIIFFFQKNRIFTSEIEISTLRRKFFLGVCGNFFRNVGCFFADEERLKVKRYLFSKPHFLLFEEGREEKIKRISTPLRKSCAISFKNGIFSPLSSMYASLMSAVPIHKECFTFLQLANTFV